MKFKQLLLYLLQSFRQERTISAPYHLVKGKRSGQTIQDAGLFSLYAYFGILPKLSRARYDEAIVELIDGGDITVGDDGYYTVHQQQVDTPPYFDGWHYRGNEHVFFARLSLAVQTLSQQQAGDLRFIPLQKDEDVQRYVRDFLRWAHYETGTIGHVLKEELQLVCQQLEAKEAQLLMQRLSGAHITGYSWAQLAAARNETQLDTQLAFVHTLHVLLLHIEQQNVPLLQALTQRIKVQTVVTNSAVQTAQLYAQGYTVEQIAHIRRLKVSTIEDHIVEMVMSDAQFSLAAFVDDEDIVKVQALMEQLQTRKLKPLKEQLQHLTYFQLRLILAKGGR